nr:nitronate monooxygenase [Marinicella sp. W31]MDC2876987.1 nitronate monooxygenase [Marinicella sp. W31]
MHNSSGLGPRLRLPVVAAPMFLASGPDLVVACCKAGICGTFPALNQRTTDAFARWLNDIEERLAALENPVPFGVNLIVHPSNTRLKADLAQVVAHKVPLVITSLGAVKDVVEAVHSYGGLVFHDVTTRRHAEKAAEAGVDGIIAVCAGAGGHAGVMSPFALVPEIRSFFGGTIALAGAMSTGAHVAAATALGADLAYIGTRFIATREALAPEGHKRMIIEGRAADILYTPEISGVPANFLKPSIIAAGLDPDHLPPHCGMNMESETKAWKNLWSAGQGIGAIDDLPEVADLIDRLEQEYRSACGSLCAEA